MKRDLAKQTGAEGAYTLHRGAPGTPNAVSVRLDALPRPAQTYHANWIAFEASEDGVALCFGQRIKKQLMSRLDVSMGFEEFNQVMDHSQDFTTAAFAGLASPEASYWHVDDPVPLASKYFLDSATVVAMAVFNAVGEMAFYRMSPRDLNILLGSVTGHAEQPVPVANVTMSRQLLCGMLHEMRKFRNMKIPILTAGGRF